MTNGHDIRAQVDALDAAVTAREQHLHATTVAVEKLVADVQTCFGSGAGERLLAVLGESYPPAALTDAEMEKLTGDQQVRLMARRQGRHDVVQFLRAAVAGKLRAALG